MIPAYFVSSRRWKKVGYAPPRPINFTDEEIRVHEREGQGWNEVQEFWDAVDHMVTWQGWTTPDRYEEVVALLTMLREEGYISFEGEDWKRVRVAV